jgi:hypothetical protein
MSRPALRRDRANVFINVPFDGAYEKLFVALITAVVRLGREPHCALEVPDAGQGRLRRIVGLINACPVSLHDVSRLRARHNMPFELRIACGAQHFARQRHDFFVFETERYRLQKTLSDLNIIDPYVHGGTVDGMLRSVLSCLSTGGSDPSLSELRWLYTVVRTNLRPFMREHRTDSVFSRPMFKALVGLALAARDLS